MNVLEVSNQYPQNVGIHSNFYFFNDFSLFHKISQ